MSLSKLLVNHLQALKKNEFDEVVKLYLKEVYGYVRVVNTDGPDDQGLDIQVFDIHELKNQYQLTVQKDKFSQKLEEDIKKAKVNHDSYGFSNSLFYFYSLPLTNKKKNEFQKDALINHGIILNLIDGNQIAEECAESYEKISQLIFKLNGIKTEKTDDMFGRYDNRYKMLYDLISFGSPSDIKGTMVKSFILHTLLSEDKLTLKDLLKKINKHFKTEGDETYCSNLLDKLKQENKIEQSKDGGKNYYLSEKEKSRLNTVIRSFELSELAFIKSINEKLDQYGVAVNTINVINQIKKLFDSNYSVNINELDSRNGDINNFEKSSQKFKKYIVSLIGESGTNELVTDLIEISENNDFLQKVCAGNFFTKVSQLEKLEHFNRLYKSNNVKIYVDTQILLRAICTHYMGNVKYDDFTLTAAKNLIDFTNNHNLSLKTSYEYCKEVVNHISNALNLIPFTNIQHLESLGSSNNVFYNYFKFLKENDHIDQETNFEAFLNEFRINEKVNLVSNAKRLLREIKIEVTDFPKEYSNYHIKELFEEHDRFSFNRRKKEQAIRYDAMMVEFLGDDDVDVHPVDPIFITWDHTFYKVRKRYFDEYPNCTKWFMFTPAKFIDYFSLLDFEISSESLSNQILSIVDEDSDFVNKTQSLLDSIVSIINPNDEVGIRYANKLNDLRNTEIKRVDEQPKLPGGKTITDEKPIVIDKIFFQLNTHFSQTKELLESYKSIFTNGELIDEVIEIISEEIDHYNKKNDLSNKVISKMSKLISK